MMDITKCKGDGCPIKNRCYRYTAKSNVFYQSWFMETPLMVKKNKPYCQYFIDNSETIIKKLPEA